MLHLLRQIPQHFKALKKKYSAVFRVVGEHRFKCVRDRLSNLDTHKSMDPDGMHPRVLWGELEDVIAEPLSIIFERSWRTGEVPEDWRKANVTPVFKKGKKEDQETTGRSASPPSQERWWSSLSWRSSTSKWKKRRLSGVVSMDSPKGNHAWPIS